MPAAPQKRSSGGRFIRRCASVPSFSNVRKVLSLVIFFAMFAATL